MSAQEPAWWKLLNLETAQFDPAAIRRTSKRHQKQTDSSHRFERQIDARALATASERAAALIAPSCHPERLPCHPGPFDSAQSLP